jgi:phenylpyruvate tautomerase PptA (4-oxalocrotonate tautomerase family)
MPLWTIHHTPGIFTDEDKHRLAASVADHYEQAGLPRFYVITLFRETPAGDFYIGGEPAQAGVRIAIDHIARHAADPHSRQRIAHWINAMVAPHLAGHPGLHWEFHVDDTSEDQWMINGLLPPPASSEAEKSWAKDNAAARY